MLRQCRLDVGSRLPSYRHLCRGCSIFHKILVARHKKKSERANKENGPATIPFEETSQVGAALYACPVAATIPFEETSQVGAALYACPVAATIPFEETSQVGAACPVAATIPLPCSIDVVYVQAV